MEFNECRREYDRLTKMGRTPPIKPDARTLAMAKNMQPWLWSKYSEDHISWAKHYERTNCMDNYGAQFLLRRDVLLMEASLLLRNLDRLSEGLDMLLPMRTHDLEKEFSERLTKLPRHPQKGYVPSTAVKQLMHLRGADGIPAPKADLDEEDGSVCLEWRELEKVVSLFIDNKGRFHVVTNYPSMKSIEVDYIYNVGIRLSKILAEITDWIYYKGDVPEIFSLGLLKEES